jgi:hypothetical protein
MRCSRIVVLTTALCTVAAVPAAALASGEPKNQRPFISSAHESALAVLAVTKLRVASALAVTGEPKNLTPFVVLSVAPKHT